MLRASLCLIFKKQEHRRRLGADFGGPGKNFADQSFRMTFFRKKFPFQRRKFLMTLFSRRLYFVCFCLSLLSYYYTPVYCYITYKTTISEKIPLPHLLYGMERISWTEHISNEEVLTLVGEERSLISTIRARQRNWMGHLLRGDSLQREIMEGRMKGKRGRGRPRQKLLDWMMSEGYGKLKEEAQNREKWSHRTSGPARGQRT